MKKLLAILILSKGLIAAPPYFTEPSLIIEVADVSTKLIDKVGMVAGIVILSRCGHRALTNFAIKSGATDLAKILIKTDIAVDQEIDISKMMSILLHIFTYDNILTRSIDLVSRGSYIIINKIPINEILEMMKANKVQVFFSSLCLLSSPRHIKNLINGNFPVGDLDIDTTLGMQPIYFAVVYNQETLLMFLINRGANVNVQDIDRNTPLHYAAGNNSINIVNILILHQDCDLTIINNNYETAEDIARSCKYYEIYQILHNARLRPERRIKLEPSFIRLRICAPTKESDDGEPGPSGYHSEDEVSSIATEDLEDTSSITTEDLERELEEQQHCSIQ